jgi:hypothetical protein
MIEVHYNLHVGSEADEQAIRGVAGWFIIHACKEPYHRRALGYSGRAAARNHPEYLIARRPGRLILNLIDVDDVAYIPPEIIDAAIFGIRDNISAGNVLVHCNQGQSRSPTIAFLYLVKFSDLFRGQDIGTAIETFKTLYPPYNPAQGMADFIAKYWSHYSSGAP